MIKNYEQIEIVYFFTGLMIVVSIFLVFAFIKAELIDGHYIKHGKVEDIGRASLQYFLTYVVPFLTIDFLKITDIASFATIFFVIGV